MPWSGERPSNLARVTIPAGTRLGASEISDAVWQWRQRFLLVLIDRDAGTPSAILNRAELPGKP